MTHVQFIHGVRQCHRIKRDFFLHLKQVCKEVMLQDIVVWRQHAGTGRQSGKIERNGIGAVVSFDNLADDVVGEKTLAQIWIHVTGIGVEPNKMTAGRQ